MAPKFSLQNVLDIRHGKVELLQIELGNLLAAQQETESRLFTLQEFHSSLLEELSLAQSDEFDLTRINLLRLNILQVQAYMESLTLELARQKQAAEDKQAELIAARQSEETLEILKRKRYEVYQAEQLQIESRAQDDIYIAQAFRNQRQGV
jgi:flagellar export protein FliJ